MTLEEAIEILKIERGYFCDFNGCKEQQAFTMAIEALEQESILDKIRAEIMDTGAYEQEVHGKTEFLKGINYCLGVIDKYKTESEDKNESDNTL